jgi:hypothetical protein
MKSPARGVASNQFSPPSYNFSLNSFEKFLLLTTDELLKVLLLVYHKISFILFLGMTASRFNY